MQRILSVFTACRAHSGVARQNCGVLGLLDSAAHWKQGSKTLSVCDTLQAFWIVTRHQMAAFVSSPHWQGLLPNDRWKIQEMAACGDQFSIYPEKSGWFGSAVVPYDAATAQLMLIARAEVRSCSLLKPIGCTWSYLARRIEHFVPIWQLYRIIISVMAGRTPFFCWLPLSDCSQSDRGDC
jgi:hypothetical protein